MDLIYITNDVDQASIAQKAGVDRIMIDLEILGKVERQGHLDTVISNHSQEDISRIREVLNTSKLQVRVNPINENSNPEIDNAINRGGDIIMLPMFRTAAEVEKFIQIINGRARACLLLETKEAVADIDKILSIEGIDEIHIGLNDLHLSMCLKFIFEPLANGIVEKLAEKITNAKIKFGFGGVAKLGSGDIDASLILSEHIRLQSSMVILSRQFKENTIDFDIEVAKIREYLSDTSSVDVLKINQGLLYEKIKHIING